MTKTILYKDYQHYRSPVRYILVSCSGYAGAEGDPAAAVRRRRAGGGGGVGGGAGGRGRGGERRVEATDAQVPAHARHATSG